MICVFHFRCRHWLQLLLPYTNIVNKDLYNAGLCVNRVIKVIRTLMFQHVILMHDHILKDWRGLSPKGKEIWQRYAVSNVKHVSKECSASIFKVS